MSPSRIQRKRTKGWRMPENAIYVGRPSKWGNPFQPRHSDGVWDVVDDNGVDYPLLVNSRLGAVASSVRLFYLDTVHWSDKYVEVSELRGHDLACWCPLDSPCHADVLLELANG